MRLALLAPFMLAALTGTAAAQPNAPEDARWISRWDHGECQLIRAVGNIERLAIKATPGSGSIGFWVRVNPAGRTTGEARFNGRLTVLPSAVHLQTAAVGRYRHEGDDIYALTFPEEATFAALTSAQALRLAADEVQLLELPLGNIAAGIDVLRQCMNDQLRAWGIDPAALSSLRQSPIPLHEAGLLGYLDDYPSDALRRGVSGSPIVRLDVGTDGRVAACTILQSSGDRTLDRGTCRAFARRARFRPALDASGAATIAPIVTQVHWRVLG